MKTKKQIRIWIDEDTEAYIKDYQYKNGMKTMGEVVDSVISNSKKSEENQYSISYITESVAQAVTDKVKNEIGNEINKIRLGTNNTDRNTQILIELMNGHLDQLGYEHFLTTDLQETMPLEISKKVVQERIIKSKQKKDSFNHKTRKDVVHVNPK